MAWGNSWGDPRVSLPRVNLLPKEIEERRLVQRQRGGVATALVLLLALLGLWYVQESQKLTEARQEADRERAGAATPPRRARPAPTPRGAPEPAPRSPPSPSPAPASRTSTSAGSCGRWPPGRSSAAPGSTSTPTSRRRRRAPRKAARP